MRIQRQFVIAAVLAAGFMVAAVASSQHRELPYVSYPITIRDIDVIKFRVSEGEREKENPESFTMLGIMNPYSLSITDEHLDAYYTYQAFYNKLPKSKGFVVQQQDGDRFLCEQPTKSSTCVKLTMIKKMRNSTSPLEEFK